jgi:hypothetical protein
MLEGSLMTSGHGFEGFAGLVMRFQGVMSWRMGRKIPFEPGKMLGGWMARRVSGMGFHGGLATGRLLEAGWKAVGKGKRDGFALHTPLSALSSLHADMVLIIHGQQEDYCFCRFPKVVFVY